MPGPTDLDIRDISFKLRTSGYPWSDPIRLNIFSYELSLIGIFLGGVPGANVFAPGQNLGWSF